MQVDRTGPESASSTCRTQLPVLVAGEVRERADAARNRLRLLDAADRLFAARGVAKVTMDDVAAEAGVGKGTLYRRFGDKGGLAIALLDERERELQQRMLSGPPPLGPDAEPAARLAAFVEAYLALLATRLDLVQMSETSAPGARFRSGAHGFWWMHCRYLLRTAGATDPDLRAGMLLAGLAAEQVRHWLRDEGMALPALTEGLVAVALALIPPRPTQTQDAEPRRRTKTRTDLTGDGSTLAGRADTGWSQQ